MSTELMSSQSGVIATIRAELDMQITTAKAYPRNTEKFVDQAIAMATQDEETAESCIYSLPRKDTNGKDTFIKGESVRLAEIAMVVWGNIHAGTRIIENDGKMITAEAVAWDLEKNVRVTKQIKRSIYSERYKKTYSQDMQVVTGNAAASIALRNAILGVVPRALVKRVYEAAVNYAIGDQKKFPEKVKKTFDKFKKMGIEPQLILDYFGKKTESEITPAELEEMFGFGTAIKEGNIKIDEAFIHDKGQETSKAADLNDKLSGKQPEMTPDDKDWVDSYDKAKKA